jgi:DNA (cytosine-5)-methyltransferase 1
MPDKDNFGAVLQPTAYRWQNDALGLQQDDAVAALRASAGSSGFHEMNHPVIAQPNAAHAAVALAFNFQGGSQQDQILTGDAVCPALAHASNSHGGHHQPKVAQIIAPSLTATNDPSRSPQSSEVTQQVAAVHASTMTVRRLSARECERLQAFPDDWTLIPWRGKPAEQCPDGPRYKALGNSMACNCMAWIGERIAAVEARHD